ncbi:hypothetical protein C0J52_19658 [Blattella germanica]|nr:hypothetical protein C0J52_19658 [Blattella germanica]
MQCGFACLECGAVRSKNTTNIMIQNVMDVCNCVGYWLFGYALAYGEGNAVIGIIYPAVTHWTWSEGGWLKTLGYIDFSGCGPIHLLGGVCSFWAAILLGPRIGRFGNEEEKEELVGHSVPLLAIGGLLLFVGFLAFNGGSLYTISQPGDGALVARIIINTLLAGAGGSILILFASKIGLLGQRTWNFSLTLNASLTGMVSVCAGVDKMEFWASFTSGATAAIIFILIHYAMIWILVDDPLDTVAVHFGGGIWGLISASFLAKGGLFYGASRESALDWIIWIFMELELVKYAEENGKREAGRKYDVDPKNVRRWVLCSEYKPHPSLFIDGCYMRMIKDDNAEVVRVMQCGFACLEAGAVRSKNTTNIIMKNFMDICLSRPILLTYLANIISAICYWLVGYALAYGDGNAVFGYTFWAGKGVDGHRLAHWFFQFVFAATAATLVSGAVAERCHFVAYITYSALITGLVYPMVSRWVWADEGWLRHMGYKDFSGCGPVHLLGGTCSLFGALFLGPRLGRFEYKGEQQILEIPGHSVPLTGLGGMILVTGFLAFNGGTLASITNKGDGALISSVICNTVMGGSGGSISISVCAGVNEMNMWESIVCGVLAGPIFLIIHYCMLWFKIDDPLDTVAIHFGGGFWGLISASIFSKSGFISGVTKESIMSIIENNGLFLTVEYNVPKFQIILLAEESGYLASQ